MSRKELQTFNPAKLKPGGMKLIEVVDQETHYHKVYYFFRDHDGELLAGVTHGFRNARTAISDWKKLKHANPAELKQMTLDLVQPGSSAEKQEGAS